MEEIKNNFAQSLENMEVTIDANFKSVDFLDLAMDLDPEHIQTIHQTKHSTPLHQLSKQAPHFNLKEHSYSKKQE